jgi:hypothetical protein
MFMSIISLITWICAAACGLYLVSIWLIEYDREYQSAARTRLPPVVLACHVMLAGGGLIVWIIWFVDWSQDLVWASAAALCLAATLGSVMAIRWIGVYREHRAYQRAEREQQAGWQTAAASDPDGWPPGGVARQQVATLARPGQIGPPERNFPLPVVIAHGVFALATLTMVLLITFGVTG